MGVLGAFFGCRGDGGFTLACISGRRGDGGFTLVCISGCRGVIGFNVATSQLPVREKVRPACSKWPKMSVLWRAGRTFSRVSTRGPVAGRSFSRKCCWRPVAGRTFSRASSRGGCWARAWRLDGGCVPPLDLGRVTDTRSRMPSRRGCPWEPQVGDPRSPFRRIPAISLKTPLTPISRGA